ncbi:hypothetical protein KUTeg_019177 [Tegillarca granosa]|uniref:Uncharacterized protein n=1 Tax=Tegillarca granosa TaxID=220873 RepID=A0ABQ9EBR1_TEGGR|nr:hypothetical protein KUTeg_019177 [Tegillarca granosa]
MQKIFPYLSCGSWCGPCICGNIMVKDLININTDETSVIRFLHVSYKGLTIMIKFHFIRADVIFLWVSVYRRADVIFLWVSVYGRAYVIFLWVSVYRRADVIFLWVSVYRRADVILPGECQKQLIASTTCFSEKLSDLIKIRFFVNIQYIYFQEVSCDIIVILIVHTINLLHIQNGCKIKHKILCGFWCTQRYVQFNVHSKFFAHFLEEKKYVHFHYIQHYFKILPSNSPGAGPAEDFFGVFINKGNIVLSPKISTNF